MVVINVDLSPAEISQWQEVARQVGTGEELVAVRRAMNLGAQLPRRLRAVPEQLSNSLKSKGIALIRGAPLGEAMTAPTPDALSMGPASPAESFLECLMLTLAGILGTPFSFASQQAGRLVLDIFPMRGQESGQLGSSSRAMLDWHVEHAFHPRWAHYILLLCLRNDQRVATRYAYAGDLQLSSAVVQELRKPHFTVLPDESHSQEYNAAVAGLRIDNGSDFSNVLALATKPPKIPIIEGDGDLISVDFPYMPEALQEGRANATLRSLREAIEDVAISVVLDPGDLLIIDNRRGVHARDEFTPRYDGSDRWLKQLSVGTRSSRSTVTEDDLRVY